MVGAEARRCGGIAHDLFARGRKGADLLKPGGYFKGLATGMLADQLDFASLMLALFCGTASLPHMLIRYYTVKDAAAARKSTVVGIVVAAYFAQERSLQA